MSIQIEEPFFDDSYFQEHLPKLHHEILRQFQRILFSFFLFNVSFLALLSVEVILFFSLLPFLMHSTFLAFSLSGTFLTVFSYFILHLYFQAKKPEQFEHLKKQFLSSCRHETQNHLSIAAALSALAAQVDEEKWVPSLGYHRVISFLFARSARQDLFRFKQRLLRAALKEQIDQVRIAPTDLEAHVSLANSYLAFSKLHGKAHEEQFREAARLAIEEFQILNDYAPNDPWIHEQLAKGYRDLSMPQEELMEMQLLVKLRPQDSDLLHRLGTLYFEQGCNAKGLRVYEELKQINYKKAEDLISSYGSRDL